MVVENSDAQSIPLENQKVLIPIYGNDVAPRFDLAAEVIIAEGRAIGRRVENEAEVGWVEKILVLSQPSSEELCQLAFGERVDAVICSGIEDEHYQFLVWKRVRVFDSVIGPWLKALKRFYQGRLVSGDILFVHPHNP